MSDRTARILVMLALVPGCAGSYVAIDAGRVPLFRLGLFVGYHHDAALLTLIAAQVFIIWLWRNYVAWTCLRTTSTTLSCFLSLAVVTLAPQLTLPYGYAWDQANCIAGACGLGAIWLIAMTYLWWGHIASEERAMSSFGAGDLRRIGISIALVPFYVAVFIFSVHVWSTASVFSAWYSVDLAATFSLCNLLVAVAWILLWGRRAKSNKWVIARVAGLALLLIGSSLVTLLDQTIDIGRPLRDSSPIFGLAIWLAGTVWLWHRPDSAVAGGVIAPDEIRCPECNYSLKGLKEVHCPECGWTSTVDQIVKLAFENAATV